MDIREFVYLFSPDYQEHLKIAEKMYGDKESSKDIVDQTVETAFESALRCFAEELTQKQRECSALLYGELLGEASDKAVYMQLHGNNRVNYKAVIAERYTDFDVSNNIDTNRRGR